MRRRSDIQTNIKNKQKEKKDKEDKIKIKDEEINECKKTSTKDPSNLIIERGILNSELDNIKDELENLDKEFITNVIS